MSGELLLLAAGAAFLWGDRGRAWLEAAWPNYECDDIERSYMARRRECGMEDEDGRSLGEFLRERADSDVQ